MTLIDGLMICRECSGPVGSPSSKLRGHIPLGTLIDPVCGVVKVLHYSMYDHKSGKLVYHM